MQEDILASFIKDLGFSVSSKLMATPCVHDFKEPAIIVCSHSSIVKKNRNAYEFVTDFDNQRYTPDIDKLFNSFTSLTNDFEITALVMTGIGDDGLIGCRNLKKLGATIFGQDEKSCAVYGMPRAVRIEGLVDKVMNIEQMIEYVKGL